MGCAHDIVTQHSVSTGRVDMQGGVRTRAVVVGVARVVAQCELLGRLTRVAHSVAETGQPGKQPENAFVAPVARTRISGCATLREVYFSGGWVGMNSRLGLVQLGAIGSLKILHAAGHVCRLSAQGVMR